MKRRVNLVTRSNSSIRSINDRGIKRTSEVVYKASKFGRDYFDGDRLYGYGGYVYDGRWREVANRIISHYELATGAKVLDIGCAKGFLVKDLRDLGIDATGIDVSRYAISNCHPEVVSYVIEGDARKLPYENNYFDLVVSFNTLHNLERSEIIRALKEISRVSKKESFVQVDSYFTHEQKKLFEDWMLTAKYHDFPEGWQTVFGEANYNGDWDWTIFSEGSIS